MVTLPSEVMNRIMNSLIQILQYVISLYSIIFSILNLRRVDISGHWRPELLSVHCRLQDSVL